MNSSSNKVSWKKILLVIVGALVGLLILFSIIIYFALSHTTRTTPPSDKLVRLGESIIKYPNSTFWEVKKFSGGCIFDCWNPGVRIYFSSNDSWQNVLSFYEKQLTSEGWIYLGKNEGKSIFAVFEKDDCEADWGNFLNGEPPPKGDPNIGNYSFNIFCRDNRTRR